MKQRLFFALLMAALAAGCAPDAKSGKGFSLPEGDIARGKETFSQLHCHACHTVADVEFDKLETPVEQKLVALGGAKTRVQTYGDLVTSIINPSHRFAQGLSQQDITEQGKSKMRSYNSEMTVQQLVDLVTFLESHYTLIEYEPTPYGPYYF